MPETDIIDFQVGLQIAVRSGNTSWYGVIGALTQTLCYVNLGGAEVKKFSRNSRFEIGSKESRYTRPYICTVARARAKDAEYARLTERARQNLAARGGVGGTGD